MVAKNKTKQQLSDELAKLRRQVKELESHKSERKVFEQAMERQRHENELIVDSLPIIAFYKDREGRFLRVNDEFAKAIKMRKEDFVGKTVFDLYSTDIAQAMTDDDQEVLKSGHAKLNIIEQYESASGIRWVRTDKIPIFDQDDVVSGLIGFAQDITERKKAAEALEESEEKYRAIVQNTRVGMASTDLEGKFTFVNYAVCRILGLAEHELLGKPFADYVYPDDLPVVMELLLKATTDTRQTVDLEFRITGSGGRVVHLHASVTRIKKDDETIGYNAILTDVTERKTSEEIYRTIMGATRDGFCIIDMECHFLDVNDAYCDMLGYSRDELLTMKVHDVEAVQTPEEIEKHMLVGVKVGHQRFESRHRCKDGRILDVEMSGGHLPSNPEISYVFIRDITERNRIQKELRESEETYRSLVELSPDMIVVNQEDKIIFINSAGAKMLGAPSPKELIGRDSNEFIHPDFYEIVKARRREAFKTGQAISPMEQKRIRLDGTVFDVESTAVPIIYRGKLALQVVTRDVTERNKAIAELQESEKLLKEIAANYPNSYVSIIENDLTVGFTSGQEFKKQGLDPTQYVGLSLEQVFGEHALLVKSNYLKTFQGEETRFELFTNNQYQLYHTVPLMDNAGKIDRILSVVENITERKLAEERYHTIISTSGDGFLMADMEGNFLDVNDAYCNLIGYSRDELLNMQIYDVEAMETPAEIDEGKRKLKEFSPQRFESRHRCKDGRVIDVDISSGYLPFGGGMAFIFVRDVTRRNIMQRELRQSEVRFRQIFDRAPVGIAIVDSNTGKFLQLNPRCGEIMGRTMKELSKLGFQEVTHPDDLGKDIKNMEQLCSGKKRFFNVEKRYIRPDGSIIWANVTFVPMWAPGETPTNHLTILEDITQRRQFDAEINRQKELLEGVVNSSVDGILGFDRNCCYTIWNPAMERISGVSKDEAIGKYAFELFPFLKDSGEDSFFYEALKGKATVADDRPYRVPDTGKAGFFEGHYAPLRDESNEVVGGIAIIHDITERRQAEKELHDKTQLLEKVFQSLSDAVFVIDEPDSCVVDCNNSALRILGYRRDELVGHENTMLHVDKAAREEFLQHLEAAVEKEGRMEGFEFRLKRKDGSIFPTKHYISPLLDEEGKRTGWISLMRDISREKQAEKALLKSRQEFRDLSRRLQTMREEERTILAREIHDELGQALTALKMDASWISSKLSQEQEALKDKVVSMISLIDNVTQTVKRLSAELRPGLLDDLGLISAMQWQAMEFTARTGIQCVIVSDPETFDIDRDIATAAFRIFQELLNNIVRHAKATIVEVNLQEQNGLLKLKIEDNGIGITREEITSSKSLGLIGMRERAYSFGGKVRIKGVPDKGTSVAVSIPLRSMRDDTNIGG